MPDPIFTLRALRVSAVKSLRDRGCKSHRAQPAASIHTARASMGPPDVPAPSGPGPEDPR